MLWAGQGPESVSKLATDRGRVVRSTDSGQGPFANFASLPGGGMGCSVWTHRRPSLRDGAGHRGPQAEAVGQHAMQTRGTLGQKPAEPGLCLVKALCPPSGLREAPLLAKGQWGSSRPPWPLCQGLGWGTTWGLRGVVMLNSASWRLLPRRVLPLPFCRVSGSPEVLATGRAMWRGGLEALRPAPAWPARHFPAARGACPGTPALSLPSCTPRAWHAVIPRGPLSSDEVSSLSGWTVRMQLKGPSAAFPARLWASEPPGLSRSGQEASRL